jgi:hypothetical protein
MEQYRSFSLSPSWLWALALVAFSLSACTVGTFTKPGLTDAQFKKDDYECSRDAAMSGYGFGTLNSVGMREECMEARGYTMVH